MAVALYRHEFELRGGTIRPWRIARGDSTRNAVYRHRAGRKQAGGRGVLLLVGRRG